jgi:chromosome segregation ATPase
MPTWIAITAAFALLVGGCSTDQAPVCDSLAAVQTSVDHVGDANVSENGLTQLKTDLNQLKSELQSLRSDAQAQFSSQIEAVRTAANQLSASIAAARATPEVTTLAAVRTSMSGLQSNVRQLADAMAETC